LKLLFVRHGETNYNRDKLVQGWQETELTALGELQAKEAGEQLRNYDIDVIFSSDLERALRTSEIINKELRQEVRIFQDWLLRERYLGEIENTNGTDQILLEDEQIVGRDMETKANVRKRVVAFLRGLKLLTQEFETAVVVTHGGFLACLNKIHTGKKSEYHDFKNGKIYEYDLDDLLEKIETREAIGG